MTTTNDPAALAARLRERAEHLHRVARRSSDCGVRLHKEAEELERLASVLEAAAAEIAAFKKLEWAVRKVVETFREDEAQGYRSRERRYAIDMLGRYLPPLPETSDKGGEDAA